MSARAAAGVVLIALAVGAAPTAGAQPASLPVPAARPDGTLGPREAEPPELELLTFGVGARIFEKFGHSALCLRYRDPRNAPVCFNYGVTGFDDGPVLIWRFLRGTQAFWVEPSAWGVPWQPAHGRPRGIIGFYSWEDRDIYRQRLPLTPVQARALETELWDSLREDRRYYYYDHFADNCATRLRDLIDKVTGGALRAGSDAPYPATFRELGQRGLAGIPALRLLTDFVIGRTTDRAPTRWEAMFHPEVLRRAVEDRLGARSELIYARRGPPFPAEGSDGRLAMVLVVLALALPLVLARGLARLARRVARRLGLGRAAIALIGGMSIALAGVCLWIGWTAGAGAVIALGAVLLLGAIALSERAALAVTAGHLALWGAVVWALAILSPIPGVRWNEVVLVLVPLDAALPFLGPARRRRYAQVRVALLMAVSALNAVGVLAQPLWVPILVAFVPLAVIAFDVPRALFGDDTVVA